MKILIIDRDLKLAKMMEGVLTAIGDIDIVDHADTALEKIEEQYYDVVITELTIPNYDPAKMIKDIRKSSLLPIIVISSIDDITKKVEFFNLGIDDYIVKPFSVDEMLARVHAILRRVNTNFNVFSYNFGKMEVNFTNKMLTVDSNYIQLNRKTYEILELLVRNKEMIMTKQQIFDRIWGYYSSTVQTVVEINIFRLRKILAEYDLEKYLKTVKSTGYMWTERQPKERI